MTKSGLKYRDVKIGNGKDAKVGDIITVHFTGTLNDGKKFISTLGGPPQTFTLGKANPEGCNEGITGMKEGGKRTLIIPPGLGYGAIGYKAIGVPPNADLHFEVELLTVR